MDLAERIANLIPTETADTAIWQDRTKNLLEGQVRQMVDIKQDGRVYRRDLSGKEASARVFAAYMGRMIGKGAYRRKEKRIARRNPTITLYLDETPLYRPE